MPESELSFKECASEPFNCAKALLGLKEEIEGTQLEKVDKVMEKLSISSLSFEKGVGRRILNVPRFTNGKIDQSSAEDICLRATGSRECTIKEGETNYLPNNVTERITYIIDANGNEIAKIEHLTILDPKTSTSSQGVRLTVTNGISSPVVLDKQYQHFLPQGTKEKWTFSIDPDDKIVSADEYTISSVVVTDGTYTFLRMYGHGKSSGEEMQEYYDEQIFNDSEPMGAIRRDLDENYIADTTPNE